KNLRSYIGRRDGVQKKRAMSFDLAIQMAARRNLPIWAIVNDGRRAASNDPEEKASTVSRRLLDPLRWWVTTYHRSTGEFVLTRGDSADRYADQFSGPPEQEGESVRRPIS